MDCQQEIDKKLNCQTGQSSAQNTTTITTTAATIPQTSILDISKYLALQRDYQLHHQQQNQLSLGHFVRQIKSPIGYQHEYAPITSQPIQMQFIADEASRILHHNDQQASCQLNRELRFHYLKTKTMQSATSLTRRPELISQQRIDTDPKEILDSSSSIATGCGSNSSLINRNPNDGRSFQEFIENPSIQRQTRHQNHNQRNISANCCNNNNTNNNQKSELELYKLLDSANLLQYFQTFLLFGGDDVKQLSEADEEEFLEIMNLVGMTRKPLHVRRLQRALIEWRELRHSCNNTVITFNEANCMEKSTKELTDKFKN